MSTSARRPPLDGSVFDGRHLWLQVSLDGKVMEPRIALASVPYAVRAQGRQGR